MKRSKGILLLVAVLSFVLFVHCEDDDIIGTCAGCDASEPWSVFGSDDCYKTRDDCEAVERADCVVCT